MDYYKHSPDLGKDEYLFVSNGSIWIADLKANNARIVVSETGIINNARFSPDGNGIVFRSMTGKDASVADLYVFNRESGSIRRVTYLNGKSVPRRMFTDVAGWNGNNPVISTDAYSPFGALTHLYELNTDTLSMKPLNLGPAAHILYSGEYTILGRYTYDMPHWKGYKGGTKGVIWSGKNGKNFKKIVDLDGHVSSPCILGGHIFFVSDHEGRGQIYSITPDGKNMKKYTNFKEHYPRHLSSNGELLMYSMGGKLYTFNPESSVAKEIIVHMISGIKIPETRFAPVSEFLEEITPSPEGDSLSIVSRGKGFVVSGDLSVKIPVHSGGRVRRLKFLDKDRIVFVRQTREGETLCIDKLPYITNFKELGKSSGLIDNIFPSPDGKRVALTDINFNLYAASTDTMEIRKIDTGEAGKIREVSWSPDGNNLVYTFPYMSGGFGQREGSVIRWTEISTGKIKELTGRTGNDYSPTFDSKGNFILYLSDRTFDPVGDRATFNYSFPLMTKIYQLNVSGKDVSLIDDVPESLQLKGDRKRSALPESISVEAGDYTKLRMIPGGLLFLSFKPRGLLSQNASGGERKGHLMHFSFATKKSSVAAKNVSDYEVSADGKTIILKDGKNGVRKITARMSKDSVSGFEEDEKIHVEKMRLRINLKEEWNQMFDEAWLLATSYFWNKDFSKKNGEMIYNRYRPMVDSVTTRFELSEIIREMQGEFNTSHSYETGGDFLNHDANPIGHLGADFQRVKEGFRIEKIYSGDPYNEKEKSPLIPAGFKEGDTIVSIQGEKIDAEIENIDNILFGMESGKIRLDTTSPKGKKYTNYVEVLRDDRYLRYRDWVETNREHVHRKTDGKVGYIHLPNMMLDGLAEFYRLYTREFNREGLLVDVRFNGGGNVSQLILEKLLRERIAFTHPGMGQDSPYPSYSVGGPMVALTNENAGSDGDIFSHSFKLLSLGPLVGTRTWGGVIGISPERVLADGTKVTQPRFGMNFKDVGFGVENHGTDPTNVVEISPDDWKRGVDPQMEKGLELMKSMLSLSK